MKILVVEDDTFLLDAYIADLRELGHAVQGVSDGAAVFEALNTFSPDIIILDIVLPKKSGLVVLKDLKSKESYADIPVLVASNVDQERTIAKAMELGAKGYFVKSNVSINEIVAQCESIVHGSARG